MADLTLAEVNAEHRQTIAGLRELLIEVQWCSESRVDYDDTVACCPICDGIEPTAYDRCEGRCHAGLRAHADDCRLAKAVGAETRSEFDG